MRRLFFPSAVTVAVLGTLMAPGAASGQDVERLGELHGVRPPAGYYAEKARNPQAFEFQHAWFRRARAIYQQRELYRQAGNISALNAAFSGVRPSRAAGQSAASAVTGTFRVPVLLGNFSNVAAPGGGVAPFDSAGYEAKLFSPTAAPPYSATTYYDEVSRGLITLTGDAYGWFTTAMPDSFYEGPAGANGLVPGSSMTGAYMTEMLVHFDSIVDFRQYDNDGPDGIPDSGDDDGFVDFVAFIHPEVGGECGPGAGAQDNMWAHRFVYSGWPETGFAPDTTNDIGFSGSPILVDDYIIQSGLGGSSGCSGAIMPIGTFTHETGHAFGIPDLYDTSNDTEGVGHWGLMGSGSWNIQDSPAHMSAWSSLELGWIAVDTIQPTLGSRSLTVTPIIDSDTAWAICTASVASNCLNEEHFLLENRVPRGADVNLKVPASDGSGLLIWHTDPARIASRSPSNTVNAFAPYGLALEQADGLNELHTTTGDRGDTGDPWPGSTGATTFGPATTPDSKLNDGSNSDVSIDSITVQPDSSITLVLTTGVGVLVTTNREGVTDVIVDGNVELAPYGTVWGVGSNHTIAVPDTQLAASADTRYVFVSWSDVAPPTNAHAVIPADATPDTFVATLRAQFQLDATAGVGGTVSAAAPGPVTLPHFADSAVVASVTATPDSAASFDSFTGDTVSASNPLSLTMDRPWSVTASFMSAVSITSASLVSGTVGFNYTDTLTASGGNGTFVWSLTGGALPAGLAIDSVNGVVSGVPEEAGSFTVVVKANSNGINLSEESEDSVPLSVGTPTIALKDVVDELLSGGGVLSAEELNFLDITGNDNGSFDIGDFRAFLQFTGQIPASVAAEVAEDTEPAASERADLPKGDSSKSKQPFGRDKPGEDR